MWIILSTLSCNEAKKNKGERKMTKTIKKLLALALVFSFLLMVGGCYVIKSQKMRVLKGTYKLTRYTYTPSYERKEGYTPKTYDYIADEEYLYEDYLVITGEGRGYYVHKQVGEDAYAKEVTLSYEYDTENTSLVSYVIFNDAITVNKTSEFNKMGVMKNSLNYTKNAFDYTQWITDKPMRSEALSVRWEKVSSKTDLSYAESQLGSLKKYDYVGYGTRGIYKLNSTVNIETGEYLQSEYKYFYYVVDSSNAPTATVYYALNESPETMVVRQVSLAKNAEDWSLIAIDGATWTRDAMLSNYYNNEVDGIKRTLYLVSNDISERMIQDLIAQEI